nr:LytTR family transcriptional regulator [Deltaproteobacteria bacterium]
GARLPIETRTGIVLVDPDAIVYAQFDGALVTIVTALGSWITTATLRELEDQLPPKFERVDRRHLLNLDEVARLEPTPDGGYVAVTRTGARVPVSRQAGRALRRRLAL